MLQTKTFVILCFTVLIQSTTAVFINRGRLYGFSEVREALASGFELRAAFNYNKCFPSEGAANSVALIMPYEFSPDMSRIEWSSAVTISNYNYSQNGTIISQDGYDVDVGSLRYLANETIISYASDVNASNFTQVDYAETFACNVTTDPYSPKAVQFFVTPSSWRRRLLNSYEEILTALQWTEVTVVQDYTACRVRVSPIIRSRGGLKIGSQENFRSGRFIPPGTGPYLAYTVEQMYPSADGLRREITEAQLWWNNSVTHKIHVVDAATYTPVSSEYYVCDLTNATQSGAFSYFAEPETNETEQDRERQS